MKNVLIIVGSHKVKSNSAKIGEWVKQQINEVSPAADVNIYDVGKQPLPVWDEKVWTKDEDWQNKLRPLREAAEQADALVCIVPEYSGMAAPAFKNLMLMLSDQHIGHKPALLIGVSSGYGGSYPVAELRMSSYKNTRILWIPDHVIVRFADTFAPPFEDNEQNTQASQRITYALELLARYAAALEQVRSSGVLEKKPYPFGM